MINGKAGYTEGESLAIARALARYPLATLVGSRDGVFTVSRIPLIVRHVEPEALVLEGHIARSNPLHHCWTEVEVAGGVVIIDGDHAYISPDFYCRQPAVPTWNYYSVYASGTVKIVEAEDECLSSLYEMFSRLDAGASQRHNGTETYYRSLINQIVVFRIFVEDICIKEKVSRHRSKEDQQRIVSSVKRRNALSDAGYIEMLEWLGAEF